MAQTNETIRYLPMSLARHNPTEVASLIYESAPDLFTLMFGSQAIAVLTALVQRSHNRFSHQYIRIAETNDRVVGMVTLVPAEFVEHNPDYDEILNFGQKLWLKFVQYLLIQHVLKQDYPTGTFYIGNLAVATEYRSQGIGRQLILQCIHKCAAHCVEKSQSSCIFISVDASNVKAQKLYESLGFQEVAMKTIRLFGTTIGSRVLSLSIPNHSR